MGQNSAASSQLGLYRRGHLAENRSPTLAPATRDEDTGLASRGEGARPGPWTILPMTPTAAPASVARSNVHSLLIPRNGLQLPRQLSFDAWLEVGQRLSTVVNSSAWCLGDWLIYGEVCFTGRYREAIERTWLDYQTLRNYAWVARKIPLSRRCEQLSFGHHAEVAALPEHEQDYWLRKAQELGWSRNQIRHEIRESLRERNADAEAGPDTEARPCPAGDGVAGGSESAVPPQLTIRMTVTSDQLELFRQAASRNGYSVEDWALQILAHAAQGGHPRAELAGQVTGG